MLADDSKLSVDGISKLASHRDRGGRRKCVVPAIEVPLAATFLSGYQRCIFVSCGSIIVVLVMSVASGISAQEIRTASTRGVEHQSGTDTAISQGDARHILVEDRIPRSVGILRPNASVDVELPLKNTSQEALEVKNIRVSCACTRAQVDPVTIGPGESACVRATLTAGAHNSDQNSALIVELAEIGSSKISHEARYLLSAKVRAECRWSQENGGYVKIIPGKPGILMATNYGARIWENLDVRMSSSKVIGRVELTNDEIDAATYQVAVVHLSLTEPASVFSEVVRVRLFSGDEKCRIAVGELEFTVESPQAVDVVPRSVPIANSELRAFLIVNDSARSFLDESVEATIGDRKLPLIEVKRISARWIQVRFSCTKDDSKAAKEVVFRSNVEGGNVESRALLQVP